MRRKFSYVVCILYHHSFLFLLVPFPWPINMLKFYYLKLFLEHLLFLSFPFLSKYPHSPLLSLMVKLFCNSVCTHCLLFNDLHSLFNLFQFISPLLPVELLYPVSSLPFSFDLTNLTLLAILFLEILSFYWCWGCSFLVVFLWFLFLKNLLILS